MYFIYKGNGINNRTLVFLSGNNKFNGIADDDFIFDMTYKKNELEPITLGLLLEYIHIKEKIVKLKLKDFKPNRKKLIKDIILWLIHQE